MELCDQGDLFEYVVQHPYDVNCHVIFLQVLEAIEYMHQHNLYHRDIKLENILLQKEDFVKVADFGLATKERYSLELFCHSRFSHNAFCDSNGIFSFINNSKSLLRPYFFIKVRL